MQGVRVVTGLLALVGAPSCFAGYDSSWGEREASQRRVASQLAPAALERADGASAPERPPAPAELRVRVHATPRHQAENLDWKRRFEDSVADANGVLAAHGLYLRVDSVDTWSLADEPDRTEDMLRGLAEVDAGADTELVIGLVSAVPRLTATFHELGAANVLGKHVVLRGSNDGVEYQAIERGFDELEPAERAKLFALRRRHKQTAVLLHEIAHVFGGLHSRDRKSLLYPTYDHEMSDFGAAPAELLHAAVAARADRARLFADLERTLHRLPETAFVESERRALLDFLSENRPVPASAPSASAARAPEPPPASAQPAPPGAAIEEPVLEGIAPAHAEAFRQVRELQKSRRFDDARELAAPLFALYPDSLAVQDLRCQLAMNRQRPWNEVKEECGRLMDLSMKR